MVRGGKQVMLKVLRQRVRLTSSTTIELQLQLHHQFQHQHQHRPISDNTSQALPAQCYFDSLKGFRFTVASIFGSLNLNFKSEYMEHENEPSKVQDLSDLELAMLLSLVSSHHAIIQIEAEALGDLETELKLAASQSFGLSSLSLTCTQDMTLDDFSQSILVTGLPQEHRRDQSSNNSLSIPNVLVIRDLQVASRTIQMQAMELLKSHRIFTHTAVHATPRQFLALLISSTDSPPLVNHLRDLMYLSHEHDPADGFPNMLDAPSILNDEADLKAMPLLPATDVEALAITIQEVTVSVEIMRYIHDIVVFLRMHRAVAAGTTPLATQYFVTMCRSLAALHGTQYVTPSLVALAAKKVFRHRLVFVTPATERSMQYGSDLAAVAALLKELTPEAVIDEVLASVDCPL